MPWCALLTAVENYNKSLEKLQDFFFKAETKTKTKCSRPRPRLSFLSSKPRPSRTTSLHSGHWSRRFGAPMRYTFDESCSSTLNHFQLDVDIFAGMGPKYRSSSLGRTMYGFSFSGCGHLFRDRQRNHNKQFAAPLILSICSFHQFAVHSHTKVHASITRTDWFSIGGNWWRILLLCCIGDRNYFTLKFHARLLNIEQFTRNHFADVHSNS